MISDTDRKLVTDLQGLLDAGLNVNQAAGQLGFENSNTLYQRIYRLGYRLERRTKLVPIHAAPLDQSTTQAA